MIQTETIEWHKFETRKPTEEEHQDVLERTGIDIECWCACPMPEDGEEILVVTKYGVFHDVCTIDDVGYGLEDIGDWDDVLYWASMPKGPDERALEIGGVR